MANFEIKLWIYNLCLRLLITPLDSGFSRFKVEAVNSGNGAAILRYLPDQSWVAENVAMKCFTKEYIHELGKLIELKRPELF